MAKYIIEGGCKLRGTIHISGNKNSILPCIAASILTNEEVTLKNVPDIRDVGVILEIIKSLGGSVEQGEHWVKINASGVKETKLPDELTNKLRASILLVGPLIARLGRAEFSHPGGDVIGKRTLEPHFQGFKELGYDVERFDRKYKVKRHHKKQNISIFFDEAGVTATENLILASVLGNHEVTLKNCAQEPHVVDLCRLLTKMGANISGIGSSTLIIKGVESLSGAEFEIGQDFVEMGTYAVAAAVTGGEITMENCTLADMEPIVRHLERFGVVFEERETSIKVKGGDLKAPLEKLHTNIWPGFPTDLMSVVVVLATQCRGVSLLFDWMYESRMFFVDKLINMGAHITIADPHRVVVYGPNKLRGREQESPDIRAGMALVLASLIADGQSVINRAELIERGYDDVVNKLVSLGAKITRLD